MKRTPNHEEKTMNAAKTKTKTEFSLGDKLFCNGYAGVVIEICEGRLAGMIVVRLDAGHPLWTRTVCVSAVEAYRFRFVMNEMTTQLWDGLTVLAKMYKGEPTALTYANRTQAQRKAEQLGAGWAVYRGRRAFYVGQA